jgi:hypothetical protein
MNRINKIIREVLTEEMGVQTDIQNLSKFMSDWILENLSIYLQKDNFNDGIDIEIIYPTKISNEIIDRIGLERFKVNVSASKNNSNKASGKFISKSVVRVNRGFYVEIDLNIEFVNDINELKNEIISVINHELNHALVFLKKYDKPSKTNTINKMMAFEFKNNPDLIEFLKMIYLSIDEEVQARVQEVGAILKELNVDNYHDAIRELYRFQPINDASRMIKYKTDNILNLDSELLKKFIKSFKENNKIFGVNKKIPNSIEDFFKSFENVIYQKGLYLNKKILKLVANKFNSENKLIKEGSDFKSIILYLSKDEMLFENIFGFGLYDWE